jgi:RimJ/RimL family protein N-acetyltransferase
MIPSITTERLDLRAPNIEDWPDYAAFMASDRARYMGGPASIDTAWGMFCHDLAQWTMFGHGALMVDERSSGCCVGQVGINAGPLFPEPELGWLIYANAEGRGLAFEAATAVRDWAFRSRGLPTLVSYIAPDNRRSIRLAERLECLEDTEAPRRDPTDLVFRHPRP